MLEAHLRSSVGFTETALQEMGERRRKEFNRT